MPEHGDFDYRDAAAVYAGIRRPDPRIASQIHRALGDARSVVNVGAGQGSYEPAGVHVLAVEPSAEMRARRPRSLVPAIAASSDHLPFDDASVDAAMSVLSVHHWTRLAQGLGEMRRVSRGPVVVVTFDPEALRGWWLEALCPEVLDVEAGRYPAIATLVDGLGGACRVETVAIPADCTDGFSEAFFARPEAFLDPDVIVSQSAWGFVPEAVRAAFLARLADDLASGAWDRAHGHWRGLKTYAGAVRLVISEPVMM